MGDVSLLNRDFAVLIRSKAVVLLLLKSESHLTLRFERLTGGKHMGLRPQFVVDANRIRKSVLLAMKDYQE